MVSEPVSAVCLITPPSQSVGLYVYTPTVARQRLGKHFRSKEYTFSSRRIVVGFVVCCFICVVSKASMRIVLPRTACFCVYYLSELCSPDTEVDMN
jgi:hypothetical protein